MAHSVVTTSKMAATVNPVYSTVTCTASKDLDNGRICTVDHAALTVKYAGADETGELHLTTTPEHTRYQGEPLTEFYNKQGDKVRVFQLVVGDIFGTSAIVGGVEALKVGDKLKLAADGQLQKDSAGSKFVVVAKKLVGFTLVADIRYNG